MTLVDAGPLIALYKPDDQHHQACTAAFKALPHPLGTVWPVLAEVMYLLADSPRSHSAVWDMIEREAVQVLPLGRGDVPRIRELMKQYADLPMDLADAALVRVAEREGINRFFTVDKKDFAVYRLYGRIRPKIIP